MIGTASHLKIALLQTPSMEINIDVHGGIERVELCELEFLRRLGHDTVLYASHIVGVKKHVVRIRDYGYRNRCLQFVYYILFGLINRRADVYHGHYTPILALLFPRKSVVHFHGLAVSELPLYRYLKRRFHRAHYVFCSKWVMEDFGKLYPAIPQSQLHVVHNGVDTEVIKPRSEKRAGPVKNICFYAGWIPEKGIYEVLQTAEILSRKRSDFKIWYGGSAYSHYRNCEWKGCDSKETDMRVRTWAARLPCVELVGDIARHDLPGFLAKMDIGLVPSVWREPFGIVSVEMMAAGLPVVAYDSGGLREQIVDGVTGFLVEHKNTDRLVEKIEYLLDNPLQISAMGLAARQHMEKKFTWVQHVEQLLEIYREISGTKR